jgi:CheY-like chemotaxis protein/signal transduction histidine kinase
MTLTASNAAELRASAPPEIEPTGAPRRGKTARVLLVDDDRRNLLALSEVLEDLAEVVCAASGEEALRFLLKERFAVVILDVLMPGMDGYDTARLLRGREQSRDTPVIFLSAINKEEQHLLRGYDLGAVDYVFKPADPLVLRSKVAVFVDLYEKTQEIRRKAAREQRLLEEKLEAERALRRSEQRQEAILSSLPVCFHARSAAPPFGALYVSNGVERLTGFAADRFLSEPGFGLERVHPDDLPNVTRALRDAPARGSYACEFRWRCADEQYRTFLDQGVCSAANEGTGAELLGTMLDVTEQRRLETQVLQAQRLDAIGKLTGGIAHDFNNLLASVLSGLSLIERRAELNPSATEIVSMTRYAAEQGKQLVSRMLAFSRRQSLAPQPVDIREMSVTLNGLLAPVLGGLVGIRWDIDDTAGFVVADPPQLELAIMNLVINARDAMPSGGTIAVSARPGLPAALPGDLEPGDYAVITVADTGRGIAPELIGQVVEPFFTTKEVGKGTGLGLSTAYGFAKQSGGTLRIESRLGAGTSVEIWLPRAERFRPIDLAPEAPTPHPARTTNATILLVDDNSSLRALTELQLSEEGFDVVTAGGGAEALALIERDPACFDVIVTDFAMPLISGLEVIRLARNMRASWPAVIITGHADAAAIAERPVDVPVVNKPYSIENLVGAIALTLDRARARA